MLQIEDYIAYLSETYFSEQEWTEEQLASLESLQQQVSESGIQIFADTGDPIIGSGGVSHSARVVVTPGDSNGTFNVTLNGAVQGQKVSFDWKALSGINGLVSGNNTVELTAGADGQASDSFTVTLNEDISDEVFTTGSVKYYVNLSNITNALFSTNDSTGGTAEAMTIACTVVEGGNVPDDYENKIMEGGTFGSVFPVNTGEDGGNSFHSEKVDKEKPTESDITPVDVSMDDFSKYLIRYGLVDTLRAQAATMPANNDNGLYFRDRVPSESGSSIQWSDGAPLDLSMSPIPDNAHVVNGVEQNVWELIYLARDPAAYYPSTGEPTPVQRNYAGAALYEPTFYLNDKRLGSQKFGAQGAKNLVLGVTPYDKKSDDWYQVGPIYEGEGDRATFDMPLSDNTKQELLGDGKLSIATPLYGVRTAYEDEFLYEDLLGLSDFEVEVDGEIYKVWCHNGGFARLQMGDERNGDFGTDGDPFLYHHVIKKIDDNDITLSSNFYLIDTHATGVYLANKNAPEVESITAPEGTYYPGQVVPVTVTFDEPVNLSTVKLTINGTENLTADSTGYSNVATVAYAVQNNQGTTVNVSSITAADSAGNKLENYNPAGEDDAGQQLDGVTMASLPSAAVAEMTGEATGPLDAPKAQLSVTLSGNANDVQWLEGAGTGGDTLDTSKIALRMVGQEELIPLTLPGQETALTGATLTAEWNIAPNDTSEEKTVVFELLLNGQVVLGKVLTVTQKPFFALSAEDFTAQLNIQTGDGTAYQFDNAENPVVYRQDSPVILLDTQLAEGVGNGKFAYPYGGDNPTYTTFQLDETGAYAQDKDGNKIPVNKEADFAVWFDAPSLVTVEINQVEGADQVKITPIQDGITKVYVTALNGGLEPWADATATYTVKDTSKTDLTIDGGLTPFFNIPNDEIRVTAGQDATVYWSSNLADKSNQAKFQVTVTDKDGQEVYTEAITGSAAAPSRVVIPADKIPYTSGEEESNTYTVTVTATAPGIAEQSDTVKIVVEPANAKVELAGLNSYYILDGDTSSVALSWSVTTDNGVNLPFSFTVTKDGQADSVLTSTTTTVSNGSSGTETLTIAPVELDPNDPNSYRDVYTVTAQVTNGTGDDATSLSYDSFLLYVYSKDALDIVVQDAETGAQTPTNGSLSLNNNTYAPQAGETNDAYRDRIVALNRDIHLKEVISVNYGTYAWNEVADQIRWKSEDSSVASIDYKQGAVYENIENFEFTTYRPTSDFLLAGHADGNTTLTATHNLLKDLSDSVNVQVETLKNKLYLFQCYPQGETTLTFEEYTNASKTETKDVTITSDENGAAAY